MGITERQAAAFRRRLFADLEAGRRSVDELLQPNDRLGDQQALLDATHAFAVVSAQYGYGGPQRLDRGGSDWLRCGDDS
ncbi:hypothetical protein ACFZCU_47420 [Streptomyces canus]|uniref:hypothetical protein n=1 Tax=Streptomyces canus TaxID=58343 RepID=UPI0036E21A50